jgi:hypothetical protein
MMRVHIALEALLQEGQFKLQSMYDAMPTVSVTMRAQLNALLLLSSIMVGSMVANDATVRACACHFQCKLSS